jgi:hypothetical protein
LTGNFYFVRNFIRTATVLYDLPSVWAPDVVQQPAVAADGQLPGAERQAELPDELAALRVAERQAAVPRELAEPDVVQRPGFRDARLLGAELRAGPPDELAELDVVQRPGFRDARLLGAELRAGVLHEQRAPGASE